MNTIKTTPLVQKLLTSHECGKREIDSYGDDWSSHDVAAIVLLACEMERQLDRLTTHCVEMINDHTKGDFKLCPLAQCDLGAIKDVVLDNRKRIKKLES